MRSFYPCKPSGSYYCNGPLLSPKFIPYVKPLVTLRSEDWHSHIYPCIIKSCVEYYYVCIYVCKNPCPSGRPMWSQLLGQLRFGCFNATFFAISLADDSLGSRLGYGCIPQLFLANILADNSLGSRLDYGCISFWPMIVLVRATAV